MKRKAPGPSSAFVAAGLILFSALHRTLGADAEATSTKAPVPNLEELSLEQLVNVEVTSVSKREEKLFEAPSAVAILTGEEIRRSGVTSIPEALRLVPGLQVARVDAHDWAISARGFNDLFANKLLVLMDGRSDYTPLFSGVFWDVQDTLMEDIDRIEVIRGPGATLWGANAVNGVINIITRSSKETQGVLVSGGGGTEERGFGQVRYGGKLSRDTYYRIYAKYFNRDDSVLADGSDANDPWHMSRTGFRVDWEPEGASKLTLQGDLYYGELHQTYLLPSLTAPSPEPTPSKVFTGGGNLLTRFVHVLSDQSEMQFQAYYDRTERNSVILEETRDTVDLDWQHRFAVHERVGLIWGVGYRWAYDQVDDQSFTFQMDPTHRHTDLYSGFLQADMEVVPETLKFTTGVKLERNDFSGFEVQPNGRVTWLVTDRQTVWAAASRAVRTPSRVENDVRLVVEADPAAPSATALFGNNDFESEELWAYELGYRIQPHARVSVDVAAFYNDYDSLRSFEMLTPRLEPAPAPPHLLIPFQAVNDMEGETYGAEVALSYSLTDWWRWRASYAYLQIQLHLKEGSPDTISESAEGTSPQHQVTVQSAVDLPWRMTFDATVRYVDHLPAMDVPSYVAMDLRLGWRPRDNLEVSVVGQHLLDSHHPEFRSTFISLPYTQVEHAVYGQVTVKF